jgi:hypothetical protein
MNDKSQSSTKNDSLEPRTQALLSLAQGLLPAMTAIIGGIWIALTYLWDHSAQAEKDRLQADQDREQRFQESRVRLLEAQKPFLDRKLQTYFDTAQVAGKLVIATPNSPEWNQLRDRFWSLRWSEMEMVGSPEIRERMRAVAEAMTILHNKQEDDPDRGEAHYLRWMVECLADELRSSMETAWQTEVAYRKQNLPGGCYAGFEEAPDPKFVPHAPGQEPPRTPAR